jgi:protein-disulfide isomerase
MVEEYYFTAHTNARLTFVIGMVIGVSIMTLTGLGFFLYVFSGGEIESYAIAPLDTDSQILTEPIKDIVTDNPTVIAGVTTDYPITLVQYVDYECRFCKKFFPDVVALTKEHSDKVRLVIKQYPLVQIHPHAKTASLAAYCADEQDKLLEYSNKLFERQNDLADDTLFDTIANGLELNKDQFSACRTSASTAQQVEADVLEAQQLGIQTQPNLVIIRDNGERQLIDGYVNKAYLAGVLGL